MQQSLGARIRQLRKTKKMSLRGLAKKLALSPAFLVDVEKDRRLPTPAVLQKLADALDVPIADFDEFSANLPKAVREWADKDPVYGRALQVLSRLRDPALAISLIEGIAPTSAARRFPLAIYESELQAIGQESARWDSETGGDLFGIWGDIPVIYLATQSGPKAVRDQAHFRLDVEYLIGLSILLGDDWGLRYFGDWHSHHRLGLQTPSAGDRARIQRVAAKNAFAQMAEFIVTFSPSFIRDQKIHVHPFTYLQLPAPELTDSSLIVLTGTSPVREALISAKALPEQRLSSFSSFPLDQVVIPPEPLARTPGTVGPAIRPISAAVIRRGIRQLQSRASAGVEVHETSFGQIIAVPITGNASIAFAFEGSWPHRVLQINLIDRTHGSSKEVNVDCGNASMTNIESVLALLDEAQRDQIGQT